MLTDGRPMPKGRSTTEPWRLLLARPRARLSTLPIRESTPGAKPNPERSNEPMWVRPPGCTGGAAKPPRELWPLLPWKPPRPEPIDERGAEASEREREGKSECLSGKR